jgi:thiopurine S-methyltransferase
MNELNETYWTNRYLNQQTSWDLGELSPPLKKHIDQIDNKNLKILIPGAGNAYEAEYLFKLGFKNTYVLDISEYPINEFKKRNNDFPKNHLLVEDFFLHEAKYDLIIEQTFFCAINPSLREKYVKKMADLLNPNGKLIGLLFNINFDSEGPPFGGNKNEYQKLFNSKFVIENMEICPDSVKPRLGNELFFYFSLIDKKNN